MNTFGERLRLTTFGESHGPAIGGVIDGYPSGVRIDFDALHRAMAERRPGQAATTQRKEDDIPEFLSGVNGEGITLGTPIGFIIRNKDCRSGDYSKTENAFRPNHADYTYQIKYGIRDHRGGGRASARETACRVVAGALAAQLLSSQGIEVKAFLTGVGDIQDRDVLERLSENPREASYYSPSSSLREKMMQRVEEARMKKDSVGGSVTCMISGVPPGLGDPVFGKLNVRLAEAMMSINAAKGFEIGGGFALAEKKGSEVIDRFTKDSEDRITTATNYSGGLQGGISNGMPIFFRVAFKPTPTIGIPVPMIDGEGREFEETVPGRHDPCVAIRAVPVVKAMGCLVMADLILS